VLTCREFGAAEALGLHFLNRVVPAGDLAATVDALAEELATKSTLTLTATKRAVNAATENLATTAHAGADADLLVSALHDDESRAAGRAYLARQTKG
jgi:enoyl-CoA hydratase/carnithine racemase